MVTRWLLLLQDLYNQTSMEKVNGLDFMVPVQDETSGQLSFLCHLPELVHVVTHNYNSG